MVSAMVPSSHPPADKSIYPLQWTENSMDLVFSGGKARYRQAEQLPIHHSSGV
jgi:hypothetical protein